MLILGLQYFLGCFHMCSICTVFMHVSSLTSLSQHFLMQNKLVYY